MLSQKTRKMGAVAAASSPTALGLPLLLLLLLLLFLLGRCDGYESYGSPGEFDLRQMGLSLSLAHAGLYEIRS